MHGNFILEELHYHDCARTQEDISSFEHPVTVQAGTVRPARSGSSCSKRWETWFYRNSFFPGFDKSYTCIREPTSVVRPPIGHK